MKVQKFHTRRGPVAYYTSADRKILKGNPLACTMVTAERQELVAAGGVQYWCGVSLGGAQPQLASARRSKRQALAFLRGRART